MTTRQILDVYFLLTCFICSYLHLLAYTYLHFLTYIYSFTFIYTYVLFILLYELEKIVKIWRIQKLQQNFLY